MTITVIVVNHQGPITVLQAYDHEFIHVLWNDLLASTPKCEEFQGKHFFISKKIYSFIFMFVGVMKQSN